MRIGGTTQDRAQYDPTTSAYVVYTVASAADAPDSLTFGSSFMTLAGKYGGSAVIGLNRGKNNITNTIAAAKVAVSGMSNLLAIELGNEPECESGPENTSSDSSLNLLIRPPSSQIGPVLASPLPRGRGRRRQMQHPRTTGTYRSAAPSARPRSSRLGIRTRRRRRGERRSSSRPRMPL